MFKKRLTGILLAVVGVVSVPYAAHAQQPVASVSQTITITARVEDNRIVIVNNRGEIMKIYSNTDKNVVPKVHLNTVNGQQLAYTADMKATYQQHMKKPGSKIGIAINVSSDVERYSDVPILERFVSQLSLLPTRNR